MNANNTVHTNVLVIVGMNGKENTRVKLALSNGSIEENVEKKSKQKVETVGSGEGDELFGARY